MPIRAGNKASLDAWQIAVQSHLASLTTTQRAGFQATASPDECLKLMVSSHRERSFTRILNLLRPIIEPLKRFENVVDVLVQTNGGIGSPIWGPLRFAIMVRLSG